MQETRQNRIARLLQKELSLIFQSQTRGMRGTMVSVTRCRISPDLSICTAYLSIFPPEKSEELIKNITANEKTIRYELGTRVRNQLRIIPELRFFIDDSLDYIEHIDELLKKCNFPFYIARRYLFSKKSTHVINIISGISVVGVAVATMALVVTLSVFNGFHDLVASLLTSFDPQIEIVPTKGKTAPADDPILTKIRNLPQVDVATESVEDQTMAIYKGRQAMIKVKGVEDNFSELSHINDILYGDGEFSLHAANLQFGVVGIRLADNLGMTADWDGQLKIYAPKREGQLDLMNPTEGFVEDSVISPGVVLFR